MIMRMPGATVFPKAARLAKTWLISGHLSRGRNWMSWDGIYYYILFTTEFTTDGIIIIIFLRNYIFFCKRTAMGERVDGRHCRRLGKDPQRLPEGEGRGGSHGGTLRDTRCGRLRIPHPPIAPFKRKTFTTPGGKEKSIRAYIPGLSCWVRVKDLSNLSKICPKFFSPVIAHHIKSTCKKMKLNLKMLSTNTALES